MRSPRAVAPRKRQGTRRAKPWGTVSPRGLAPSMCEAVSGATLLECILRRGERPKEAVLYVDCLESRAVRVTAGRLIRESKKVARGLIGLGVKPGERVLIVLPTGTDFVTGFLGILLAGATPVPAYPPAGIRQLASFTDMLSRMVASVQGRFIVVPELLREVLQDAKEPSDGRVAGASIVTPEQIGAAAARGIALPPLPSPDDLALVQFSSGSTGDPRGVCLTHTNVMTNIRAFLARLRTRPGDVCVTWLPLYHDMGLIGTLLGSLTSGITVVLMPPTDFLRKPEQWLRLMGKYRATLSVAPQFAYNLCVRKADPAALRGVDLSSLRVLLNGAEPIQAEGVASFQKRFRALGLRSGVVTPCYGLAEGTLAASMQNPGTPIRLAPLPPSSRARKAKPDGTEPKIVSVGPPLDGTEIGIRLPRGGWVGERRVGEICLRSASICVGHTDEHGLRRATDARGWLRTGDLGFLDAGELFVTGRLKDLIIIGGRNFYPHDLEAEAARLPGFRPGRIVAFGVTEPGRATEALVIVAETQELDAATAASSVARLRQMLLGKFAIAPYDTVLLKRGTLPLTTSGKLRRVQTRTNYERGLFDDAVYQVRRAGVESADPGDATS